MSNKEMSFEDKAELLMVTRNYKFEKKEKWTEGIDFIASEASTEEKILLRLIEPQTGSGFVGTETVKTMKEAMKNKQCARGFLIGKRFTDAASEEMSANNIQQVSEDYMPPIESQKMILAINDYVNNLCTTKCGSIPAKKTDCKAHLDDNHCEIKSISDDAMFHLKLGSLDLITNDLKRLLFLSKTQQEKAIVD
jgi:hypothetical protein